MSGDLFSLVDGGAPAPPFIRGRGRSRDPRSIAQRLDDNSMPVPECGCKIWLGTLFDGYGRIKIADRGSPIGVHRVAWELENGPVPDGAQVLHHCDLRCCIESNHLFLGDNDANMADRDLKGRQARGAGHGLAKLTAVDVAAIRASSATLIEFATAFDVSISTISRVRRRKTWAHIFP